MKLLVSTSATLHLDKSDLKALARNPADFAASLYLSDLVSLLKTANAEYHNQGASQLSDSQYDILLNELRTRKPTHSFLSTIGSAPGPKVKVKLPYSLFSLDKIKPGEASFSKWFQSHPGPYVLSDKIDGVSVELIYENGKIAAAYTRGDGIEGQYITHLTPYMNIPKTVPVKHLVVRSELVMDAATFDAIYSKHTTKTGKYDNARNLVAGAVNTKGVHTAIKHMKCICYEIIEPRTNPSAALAMLKKFKFTVVPHKLVNSVTEDQLSKLLAKRKVTALTAVDGIVVEQDKKTRRPVDGNPTYAVAFKETTDNDTAIVKVVGVKWQTSKYGMLKPVVMIEPTRLGGVSIKQCTGFTANFIETGYRGSNKEGLKPRPIGPGALVKITRSGDVIPHILEVVKAAKTPDLPKDVDYEYNGLNIQLVDKSSDVVIQDKLIAAFFAKLGIDYIGQGVVRKLRQAGFTSIIDILKAQPQDFLAVEGFKATMANKVYQSIKDVTSKPIALSVLMPASGVFDQGLGERKISMILDVYPNILEQFKGLSRAEITNLIIQVPSFQQKTASVFVSGLPKFIKWLKASGLKVNSGGVDTRISTQLANQKIAFTGFRDKQLEEKIKLNSGVVASGVTKDTTILLVKNVSSTSDKTRKAQDLKIPVMTAAQFIKRFKL